MGIDEITFKEFLHEEKKLRELLRKGEITSTVHDLKVDALNKRLKRVEPITDEEYQRRKGGIDDLLKKGEITPSDHKLRCDILAHTKKVRDQPFRTPREILKEIRERQIHPDIIDEARYQNYMTIAAEILDLYGEEELAELVRRLQQQHISLV